MDLASFLDFVIADGHYLCVATKSNKSVRGIVQQFFPRQDTDAAAQYISDRTITHDVWFAVASFPNDISREQNNVELLKAFWFDADIKREGDGKDITKAFADLPELILWVKNFVQNSGIPLPNLWVRSGYGVHLYWVFDEPLTHDEWKPYAQALKAALGAHGAKGDLGVVADAARILRAPETFNYKDLDNPALCYVMVASAEYDRSTLLATLSTTSSTNTLSLGTPSAVFQGTPSIAANARAGLDSAPRDFAVIAQECAQVRRSLDEGGANDGRQLWHGLVTLAHFCEEGREWAHRIGDQHPAYTEASTDREFDQVGRERRGKDFGPPTCERFNNERKGVCDTCPHWDKIKTPWTVGQAPPQPPPSSEPLPDGYQQMAGHVIYKNPKGNWVKLVNGEFSNPTVERVSNQLRLSVDYTEPDSHASRVNIFSSEFHTTTIKGELCKRGLTVDSKNAPGVLRLLMSWLEQLRDACQVRDTALPAFGWVHEPAYDGFAVGGRFYNLDGSEHPGVGDDDKIVALYQPRGDEARWRQAAEYIITGVPELATAVALSFGAPLMELSGEISGCISFVGESGVGKTSAFKAGAGIWAHPIRSMLQLNDTDNYHARYLGQTKVMPVYWDEAQFTTKDGIQQLIGLLHKLTQGRDKGRLTADVQARESGSWQTIYSLASNNSVTDAIGSQSGYTSATMLRVLEIRVGHKFKADPLNSTQIVPLLDHNYGHAGRVFAKHIASDQVRVRQLVGLTREKLLALLPGYRNEERFYLAMSSCIVAGAAIANKIGLLKLDVNSIALTLTKAITNARAERDQRVPQSPQDKIKQVLQEFINAHADGLFINSELRGRGFGGSSRAPRMPEFKRRDVPCIQIAVADKVIRFDKNIFKNWCPLHGYASVDVLNDMEHFWNAQTKNVRGHIGAGSQWRTHGKVYLVDISLDRPALSEILDQYPEYATTVVPGSNVIPLPPRS